MLAHEKCIKIIISGQVQGVWYRGWLQETARLMGLRGWAKNRLNGTVEACICGLADEVDRIVELCYKGPRLANVTDIEAIEDYDENPTGFEVLRTD